MLTEYLTSALVVLSNLSVGPSPRTNIFIFLLMVYVEELLPTSKITPFLPHSGQRKN